MSGFVTVGEATSGRTAPQNKSIASQSGKRRVERLLEGQREEFEAFMKGKF
jgi:hypothetical protein